MADKHVGSSNKGKDASGHDSRQPPDRIDASMTPHIGSDVPLKFSVPENTIVVTPSSETESQRGSGSEERGTGRDKKSD